MSSNLAISAPRTQWPPLPPVKPHRTATRAPCLLPGHGTCGKALWTTIATKGTRGSTTGRLLWTNPQGQRGGSLARCANYVPAKNGPAQRATRTCAPIIFGITSATSHWPHKLLQPNGRQNNNQRRTLLERNGVQDAMQQDTPLRNAQDPEMSRAPSRHGDNCNEMKLQDRHRPGLKWQAQ